MAPVSALRDLVRRGLDDAVDAGGLYGLMTGSAEGLAAGLLDALGLDPILTADAAYYASEYREDLLDDMTTNDGPPS